MDLVHHTHMENLSSAHVDLAESYALFGMDPIADPTQTRHIPRNSTDAQSSEFASEWESARDREIHGFLNHNCFIPVHIAPGLRTLPGTWLFSTEWIYQSQIRHRGLQLTVEY